MAQALSYTGGYGRATLPCPPPEGITDYLRTSMGLPEGIPGVVMAIHTFGEYLDFHPHLHALVADGLFLREQGRFHILPETSLQPLEELFRARVIAFLVKEGLLSAQRARMLLGWRHSGFNVYAGERVGADRHDDLERLAQYIIRNPFSVEKMHLHPAPRAEGQQSIIYRSRNLSAIARRATADEQKGEGQLPGLHPL